MAYGSRTGIPLGAGLLFGIALSLIFFSDDNVSVLKCPPENNEETSRYVDVSEDWEVQIKRTAAMPVNAAQQSGGKVIRARFAATELGMREKLIVIVLAQSTLSVALNTSIGHHVPRVHLFADASRIDADMSALSNLSPYRPNGQHAHVHILNAIFNMTLHENYDWFFFMPDSTYANPFELLRFVNGMNWNSPLAIGRANTEDKNCVFQGGILLSNPAMQMLIQQRHSCSSIAASSDATALELCIHHATNLSCLPTNQGHTYRWWRVEDSGETGSAVHDRVHWLSSSREFNSSLTVSPLLSELDAYSLHEHFVHVETDRIDAEIEKLSKELDDYSYTIDEGPSWPIGMPSPNKPPNRYQVPVWEYFTESEIFKNEPNQNVRPLVGNDASDIREVLAIAREKVENNKGEGTLRFDGRVMDFTKLRNGYRSFNARRGMEYVLDLEYRNTKDDTSTVERVHICRPIQLTQLLQKVPYVKEDTDITIVVPVGLPEDVRAARGLLSRHVKLCTAMPALVDSRQTRLVLAVRAVDAFSVRELGNDLLDLKRRCKSWQTDTALLLLKANDNTMIDAAAMDEAVDHYGQQMIYVLLSPHADYQREFLDRVRINTIRHFQVFLPIPFAEFHPLIVTADQILNMESGANAKLGDTRKMPIDLRLHGSLSDRLRQLNAILPPSDETLRPIVVHKDRGIFDVNDFRMMSFYGSDYINLRQRLNTEEVKLLDLSSLFLGQKEIHNLRAVEPALRIRSHQRICNPELASSDLLRCQLSQKQTLGTKSQLATVVFSGAVTSEL